MPTYLYECQTHGEFEEFHSINTKLEECPKCKEENLPLKGFRRLITGSSKGVVILSGHELTSKHKEDVQKLKQEVYGDPNKYANIVGEKRYHDIQTKMDRYK